jgi:CheY-like chemotaxis protein
MAARIVPVRYRTDAVFQNAKNEGLHRGRYTLSKLKILVVDDSQDCADSLAKLLAIMGHDVRASYSSSAAVEQAERHQPDLMLLDIGMPEKDGYAIARELRGRPAFENAMLVAVTGWVGEDHRRRALESGFDGHLAKPVGIDELDELIARVGHPRVSTIPIGDGQSSQ